MWLKLMNPRRNVFPSGLIGLVFLLASCAPAGRGEERTESDSVSEPDTRDDAGPELATDGSSPPSTDASVPDPGVLPDPIRIMPLGDSLTVGTGAGIGGGSMLDGGYRIRLRERLLEAGYGIDFIGRQSNGPASDFDREHESENGASIAMISGFWNAAVGAGHEPHVVLLMAGTNDQLGVTADQLPEPAARALEQLIQQILTDSPEAQVVVALPPPLGSGFLVGAGRPARMKNYSELVRDLLQRARDEGKPVHLADLSGLDPGLLGDGVHPSTMQGYNAMADLWYESVVAAIEELRQAP